MDERQGPTGPDETGEPLLTELGCGADGCGWRVAAEGGGFWCREVWDMGRPEPVSGKSRSLESGVKVVEVQDMRQVTPQGEQDRQGATCGADPGVWRGMTWYTWK